MHRGLRGFATLASLALTLGSAQARAEGARVGDAVEEDRSSTRGAAFAMAAGVALPVGDTRDVDNLLLVPLSVGLDVRLREWLELGAALEYAEGIPVSCDWVKCSGRAFRGGPFVRVRGARLPAQPWLSLGIGYRMLFVRRTSDDFTGDRELGGPEWLRLEGGLDFGRGPRFGPFLFASLGEYTNDLSNVHASVSGGAVAWAGVGVRATFGP